jgi:hypothetical protein
MGVVGGLGDVAVYATKFGEFARRLLTRRRWTVCGAVVLSRAVSTLCWPSGMLPACDAQLDLRPCLAPLGL